MPTKEQLMDSWRHLCRKAGLSNADDLGATLIACYSEPHRVYHGLDHLYHLIKLLEELSADPRILLAAWFHDAIYLPGQTDNEARSAALALEKLGSYGYPRESTTFVSAAILATASHHTDCREFDVLLDADLSILGASAEEYLAYRTAIRREYALMTEQSFIAGRLAFVRTMLSQPFIYQTTYCRNRYELPARQNLQAELEELLQKIVATNVCN